MRTERSSAHDCSIVEYQAELPAQTIRAAFYRSLKTLEKLDPALKLENLNTRLSLARRIRWAGSSARLTESQQTALMAEEHTADNRGVENRHGAIGRQSSNLSRPTKLACRLGASAELPECVFEALVWSCVKVGDFPQQVRNGSQIEILGMDVSF